MASEWFYTRVGKGKSGPISSAQLQALAKSGQLQPTDMVWKDGMAQWTPASKIKGLFPSVSVTAKTPAPMPTMPDEPGDGQHSNALSEQPAQESLVTRSVQYVLGQSKPVLAAGACLFAFFAICGFCGISGMFSSQRAAKETAEINKRLKAEREQAEQEAKQDLAEASRLWAAGNKSGAVTKYKAVLLRGNTLGEGPTMYQRVIEFEAEQGNTSAARELIEKAQRYKIPLSLVEPKAKEIAAQIQKERQEQEAAAIAMRKQQEEAALAKRRQEEELALAKNKQQEEKIAAVQPKDTEPGKKKEKTSEPRPKKGINRANFERIKEGMTRQEVEDLLGSKGKTFADAGNLKTMTWEGGIIRRVVISISFQDDRVTAKAIVD